MNVLKKFVKKTWVFAAAAVMIVGSTTAVAFAVNNTIPENASASIPASVGAQNEAGQIGAAVTGTTLEFTVIDRSKLAVDSDELKREISQKAGMTPEKVEAAYEDVIANMTPGEKDMTADQAAAYCASIIRKAYGADLTGYTADLSFSRNPLPYSDNWGAIFHAPDETDSSVRYYASVNSVTGVMLDAGRYDMTYRENSTNDLNSPEWVAIAENAVSGQLPAGVTITGSKVASATELTGVSVVCSLSDGSAMGVRMEGADKTVVVYIAFPNGYDGSLDFKPVAEGGVG
jgi:hypothetical protein